MVAASGGPALEVLALIDKVKNFDGKVGSKPKDNEPLIDYGGKTPEQLRNLLRSMLMARRIERESRIEGGDSTGKIGTY